MAKKINNRSLQKSMKDSARPPYYTRSYADQTAIKLFHRLPFWITAILIIAAFVTGVYYFTIINGRSHAATHNTDPGNLRAVLDIVKPGDTVLLSAGLYNEDLEIAQNGTETQRITIRAASGAVPIIKGHWYVTGKYNTISGLVFDGAGHTNSLVYVYGGHNTEISYNEFRNGRMSAIGVWDTPGNNIHIHNNWIHDIGLLGWTGPAQDSPASRGAWAHGVYYAKGAGGKIENNRIEKIGGYCIQAYPNPQGLMVKGNECHDTGRYGRTYPSYIKGGITVGSDNQGGSPLASHNIIEGNYVHSVSEYGYRTHWQNELNGPFGIGNIFRNNFASNNGAGNYGQGAPYGSTWGTTGAAWHNNAITAPSGGTLVAYSSVGPASLPGQHPTPTTAPPTAPPSSPASQPVQPVEENEPKDMLSTPKVGPIPIPANVPIAEDGTITADIDGDGRSEVVMDSNKDGKIDLNKEVLRRSDGTDGPLTTMVNDAIAENGGSKKDLFTLKVGPMPEAKIPKYLAYTFLVGGGLSIAGIGSYFAITKLSMFTTIRSRFNL